MDHGHLKSCCENAVTQLASLGYINVDANTDSENSTYSITMLGKATYKGVLIVTDNSL